ncbi:MAG: hypothetical protein ACU0GG_16430 [Paracoccaceae bacterium]
MAEGLDVKDEEFETWLSLERAATRETPKTAGTQIEEKVLSVIVLDGDPAQDELSWERKIIGDCIAYSIAETFPVKVYRTQPEDDRNAITVRIETHVKPDKSVVIRFVALASGDGAHLWSRHGIVDRDGLDPYSSSNLTQLIEQVQQGLRDLITSRRVERLDNAGALATIVAQSFRGIFSLSETKVNKSYMDLSGASHDASHGLVFALLAQARTVAFIERHGCEPDGLRDETAYFCARALELTPGNSMALALVSNANLFVLGQPQESFDLARRAVAANPCNAMAWWSFSSAKLYCGNSKDAYSDAIRAQSMAMFSPIRYWWDQQVFASSMMLGKTDEAILNLREVTAQAPNFKPPLRYLTALYASVGETQKSLNTARKLAQIEPDFTIDRLLSDGYPASLIHKSPIVDLDRLAQLR